jgi:transcription elongation GreA/GreB family factor
MKEKIVQQHLLLLQDKEDVFRDMISGLAIDAQNDAKGSAGDKHETALSMMHLEQEKLTKKLQEIIAQKSILQHIDRTKKHNKIALGSLVKANTIWLFVSAALPKIEIDTHVIFSLSPNSPLGLELMGKTSGDEFKINNTPYKIVSVE